MFSQSCCVGGETIPEEAKSTSSSARLHSGEWEVLPGQYLHLFLYAFYTNGLCSTPEKKVNIHFICYTLISLLVRNLPLFTLVSFICSERKWQLWVQLSRLKDPYDASCFVNVFVLVITVKNSVIYVTLIRGDFHDKFAYYSLIDVSCPGAHYWARFPHLFNSTKRRPLPVYSVGNMWIYPSLNIVLHLQSTGLKSFATDTVLGLCGGILVYSMNVMSSPYLSLSLTKPRSASSQLTADRQCNR